MERFAIKIDKKLKANLYKICRLCGIENPEMVPIIPDEESTLTIDPEPLDADAEPEMPQKIKLLIGLMVTKDDKMPQTMCSLCVDKINDFYEFREMCYATHTQTRKLLGLKSIKKAEVEVKPKLEVKEEEEADTILPLSNSVTKTIKTETKSSISNSSKATKMHPTATNKSLGTANKSYNAKGLKSASSLVSSKPAAVQISNSKLLVGRDTRKRKFDDTTIVPPVKKDMGLPTKKELITPAVSNKKLRLATASLKEAATKKAKLRSRDDVKDSVKEEIKEEPKEVKKETPLAPASVQTHAAPAPLSIVNKLKQACSICSERFSTKGKLEAHIRSFHIPRVERFVCTACDEIITKGFDIKNHQLWHKLSKTPYVCGLCGESIVSTYAYARHLREHSFETPPGLLVLDRECPQCHILFATNFLYNIHACSVRTKRCAGCNRLQRNEIEFMKHSALCAKSYLNYSKHINPIAEAQEDAVCIKNENDVEAAAEEMARLTGVPLDMAPVVQLTRLSSPLIMAASQCVSTAGIEDSPTTSSKKIGKKAVLKRDLKRVDELLKSTLDALVSIKHEPEVHVDVEPPIVEAEQSDDHASDSHYDDAFGNDDFQQNNFSDDDDVGSTLSSSKCVTIKRELDENHETSKADDSEILNKSSGGGLKLKIRKEHGQLNSSIIEQQMCIDKRAEKRKKKKKHKDKDKEKEKEKQRSQKEPADEHNSLDSHYATQTNEELVARSESPVAIRIKTEPADESEMNASSSNLVVRAKPEATIMTSIPMMQFQIACISEGVEFNGNSASTDGPTKLIGDADNAPTVANTSAAAANLPYTEQEDVKPNREQLDRLLKITHVSSGVEMENSVSDGQIANEVHVQNVNPEGLGQEQNTQQDCEEDEPMDDLPDDAAGIGDEKGIEATAIPKTNKAKRIVKNSNSKQSSIVSRNKACKSTAKSNLSTPCLQISSVQSGITMPQVIEPPMVPPTETEFEPHFIKPEPQNRGYSDENLPLPLQSPTSTDECDLPRQFDAEEQAYISSLDFNTITIKQEQDLDINDVEMSNLSQSNQKCSINGVKKRKVYKKRLRTKSFADNEDQQTSHVVAGDIGQKHGELFEEENGEDYDPQDTEEAEEEEEDNTELEEEEEDEDDEEHEDEEEDEDEDEEEEREYREMEYPPELEKPEKYISPLDDEIKLASETNQSLSLLTARSALNTEVFATPPSPIDCSTAVNIDNVDKSESLETSQTNEGLGSNEGITIAMQKPYEAINRIEAANKPELLELKDTSEQMSNTLVKTEPLDEADRIEETKLTAESECNHLNSFICEPSQINDTGISKISHTPVGDTLNVTETSLKAILLRDEDGEEPNIMPPPKVAAPTDFLPASGEFHISSVVSGASDFQIRSDIRNHNADEVNLSHSQGGYSELLSSVEISPKFLGSCNNASVGAELNINANQRPITLEHPTELGTFSHEQKSHFSTSALSANADQPNVEMPEAPHTSSQCNANVSETVMCTVANHHQDWVPLLPLSAANVDNIGEIISDSATIAGVLEQLPEKEVEAKPFVNIQSNEGQYNDEPTSQQQMEDGSGQGDLNTERNALNLNVEEQQNLQNQEQWQQACAEPTRPTALALHPYLEDISSSSNSFLSNTLSQTPPPVQTACSAAMQLPRHASQNSEETENILNESSDVLGRLPAFNFDNINEIAENNNNANLEREQLQDDQPQEDVT